MRVCACKVESVGEFVCCTCLLPSLQLQAHIPCCNRVGVNLSCHDLLMLRPQPGPY